MLLCPLYLNIGALLGEASIKTMSETKTAFCFEHLNLYNLHSAGLVRVSHRPWTCRGDIDKCSLDAFQRNAKLDLQ